MKLTRWSARGAIERTTLPLDRLHRARIGLDCTEDLRGTLGGPAIVQLVHSECDRCAGNIGSPWRAARHGRVRTGTATFGAGEFRLRRFGNDAPHVRIRTFGQLEIEIDARPAPELKGRSLDLMMALLSLGPFSVAQEVVASTLWPGTEGDAAQKALEITVHRLRSQLGHPGLLIVRDRRVGLAPDHAWIDTVAFEDLLARIDAAGAPTSIQPVLDALVLYRGEFLESEGEQPFVLRLRERLRLRLVRAVERAASTRGVPAERLDLFRAAASRDPLNESFQCGLITSLAAVGRIAEAVDAMRRYESLVMAMTGTPPSPRMRATVKAALDGHE